MRRRRGAEHFAGGGLVETGLDSRLADGLQKPQGSQAGDVARILGHVEAHAHMALGAQVIDLIRPDLLQKVGQLSRNAEVAVVKIDPGLRVVEIPVQMIDPVGVECAGPADEAVDLIPLAEQKLCQVGTVLARDPGDERFFHLEASRGMSWRISNPFRPRAGIPGRI